MLAPWGRGMLSGFGSITAEGTIAAKGGIVGAPKLLPAATTDDTGALLLVAGRAYARYIGQASKDLTSIDAIVYVSGAAAVAGAGGAALNWAEVAVATGTYTSGAASIDLTPLAYASCDAEVKAGTTTSYVKTLSDLSITAGTGLWIMFAASYETTQPSLRTPSGTNVDGSTRIRAATQPSANIGSPLAFTWTVGAGLGIPWLRAVI